MIRNRVSTLLNARPARRSTPGSFAVAALIAAVAIAGLTIATGFVTAAAIAFVVGLGALVALRPSLSLIGFSVSAVMSEWFYEAHTVGLSPLPSIVTSVSTWSIVVVLCALLPNKQRGVGGMCLRTPISRALVWFALAVAVSIAIGALRNQGAIYNGFKDLLVAVSPIPVMVLLARDRNAKWGLRLIVAVTAFECAYGLLQRPQVHYGNDESWLTLGQRQRWWDSHAVFGTFATSGSHAYANALVMLLAVVLPWATLGRRQLGKSFRLICLVLCVAIGALVLLSLTRAAVLTAAVVVIVLLASTRSAKLGIVLAIAVVAVVAVPSASSAFDRIESRGILDQSVATRLAIWHAMQEHPSPKWLIGEGNDSVGKATAELHLDVQGPQATVAGPTTDNLYLRRLIEQGIFGFLTLLYLIISLFVESFRRRQDEHQRPWRIALRCLVVAIAIQSLTSDTIYFQQSAGIFALCIAAIGAGLIKSRSGSTDTSLESPDRQEESVGRRQPALT